MTDSIDLGEELKDFRIGKLNLELRQRGIVELTPTDGKIKLMGDDVLVVADSIINYQTNVRLGKGMDIQLLELCGNVMDITAKGVVTIVNSLDYYDYLLKESIEQV